MTDRVGLMSDVFRGEPAAAKPVERVDFMSDVLRVEPAKHVERVDFMSDVFKAEGDLPAEQRLARPEVRLARCPTCREDRRAPVGLARATCQECHRTFSVDGKPDQETPAPRLVLPRVVVAKPWLLPRHEAPSTSGVYLALLGLVLMQLFHLWSRGLL